MSSYFPLEKQLLAVLSNGKENHFPQGIFETVSIQYRLLLSSLTCYPVNQRRVLAQMVFPILSIYQSMKVHRCSTEEAFSIAEMVLKRKFSIQLKGIRFLNDLIRDPFPIIRPVLRMMVKFSNLPKGQEIVQNGKDCFAINVHQCFIYDALKIADTPELTPVFCASDDWLSAEMPKISWRRTQTLGGGGDLCDFCWCRQELNIR